MHAFCQQNPRDETRKTFMSLSPSDRPEQEALAARFAAYLKVSAPPPALPVSLAEAAQRVIQARRIHPLQRLPGVARALERSKRTWRIWRSPELAWRAKVLATPWVGAAVAWLRALVGLGAWRRDSLQRLMALEAGLARLSGELASARAALTLAQDQWQATTQQLAERLEQVSGPAGGGLPPAVYALIEAPMRGEPQEIEARLAAYLPYAREAAATGRRVADLGCGRGEWLELLRREGIAAVGVDGNAAFAAQARAKGLSVAVADGLAWLRRQPPGSLGMVSLFHVVEHLPPATLWAWLTAAAAALAPGGFLLIETPNPENLQVAGYSFWLDPTHQRPLPPPLMTALVSAAGFEPVELLRHAPWPQATETDAAYPPHLRKLLFCEQDYGLVARRTERPT